MPAIPDLVLAPSYSSIPVTGPRVHFCGDARALVLNVSWQAGTTPHLPPSMGGSTKSMPVGASLVTRMFTHTGRFSHDNRGIRVIPLILNLIFNLAVAY